jgi:hypothetical protein
VLRVGGLAIASSSFWHMRSMRSIMRYMRYMRSINQRPHLPERCCQRGWAPASQTTQLRQALPIRQRPRQPLDLHWALAHLEKGQQAGSGPCHTWGCTCTQRLHGSSAVCSRWPADTLEVGGPPRPRSRTITRQQFGAPRTRHHCRLRRDMQQGSAPGPGPGPLLCSSCLPLPLPSSPLPLRALLPALLLRWAALAGASAEEASQLFGRMAKALLQQQQQQQGPAAGCQQRKATRAAGAVAPAVQGSIVAAAAPAAAPTGCAELAFWRRFAPFACAWPVRRPPASPPAPPAHCWPGCGRCSCCPSASWTMAPSASWTMAPSASTRCSR